jgi:hypothetical protein
MSITGGIKTFKQSMIHDASVTADTGQSSADRLLDSNSETYWRSVGSDDTTTENIIIEFAESKTIDRLFLKDINLKEFNVQYDNAGWTNFTNVVGIVGNPSLVSETDFALNTAYYEFDSVTTNKIRIQATKTQIADQEKYINQVIVTEELSTLVGYPEVGPIEISRNSAVIKTVSGKVSAQKSLESVAFKLKFKNYPSSSVYNVDIGAMMTLHDMEDPFLVWLCGGRYSSTHFNYVIRGFRLQDIYQMQIIKKYKLSYLDNIYINPINLASVDLAESI